MIKVEVEVEVKAKLTVSRCDRCHYRYTYREYNNIYGHIYMEYLISHQLKSGSAGVKKKARKLY